jgi:AraC-like DNA-binding protein
VEVEIQYTDVQQNNDAFTHASVLANIPSYCARLGGLSQILCDKYKVQPEEVNDPNKLIKLEDFTEILKEVALATSIGHLGTRLGYEADLANWGEYGFALMNAPRIDMCIECFVNYLPSWQSGTHVQVVEQGGHIGIEYQIVDPNVVHRNQDTEFMFSIMASHIRKISGSDIQPSDMTFQHKPLTSQGVYEQYYGLNPLFEASYNTIWYDKSVMQKETKGTDQRLYSMICKYLDEQQAHIIAPESFTAVAERNLRSSINDGLFDRSELAGILGVHDRKLQRELKKEGTSFTQILNQVRHSEATRLLKLDNIGIAQIAFCLNFSDSSAFINWFKKNSDMTPTAYRLANAP